MHPDQVSEFQENIVVGHSVNQPALTNVDSNMISKDSVSSTQDTNDPGSSSTIRTENLSYSFIDINMSANDSFSSLKSQSVSASFNFMNPSQLEEFENETVTLNDKNEMSPQFSSIQDNVDNVTLSNSKILNELHKEKMRQTNKISSKNDTKFNNDMAESVPGLYRLLDLCKDDGSNGLVDKIIIYKEGLKNLCNDLVQHSFKSISEIDYNQLNSCSLRLIGCYGNHNSIAKFLLNKNIIDYQLYEKLIHSSQQTYNIQGIDNKPRLRPGIYLLMVNSELGLVIHWPEYGCYEDNASSQRKKNMINLHRYLTKLTDYQICLMSEQDLNSFDWKRDEEEILKDNDGVCYEFEVQKSQEEREDFEIFNGFNVILPNIITSEINQSYNEILLHPKVIESVSYQTFFTQKIIAPSIVMIKCTTPIAKPHFNKEFMDRWGNCSVRIDRSTINMKMLEILVKYELSIDDLKEQLDQYNEALKDAKEESDNKKAEEREVNNDAEFFRKLAYKELNKLYRRFERINNQSGNDIFENKEKNEHINDNGEDIKNEEANKNKNASDNENANDNEEKSEVNEDGEENINEEANKNKDASDNENANDNEEKSDVNEDGEENKNDEANKNKDASDNENANDNEDKSEANEDGRANEELFSKYPDLKNKLNQTLKINTPKWKTLKFRYIFGVFLLKELNINEINAAIIWRSLYDTFTSGNTSSTYAQYIKHSEIKEIKEIKTLLKKHKIILTKDQINDYDNQVNSVKSLSNSFPDSGIIDKLFDQEGPENPDLRKSIILLFLDSYNQWKDKQFPNDIEKIKPQWTDIKKHIGNKLDEEYKKKCEEIENNTIEILCTLIEEKFPNGPLCKITNITETSHPWNWHSTCNLTYELDTIQPAQLQITIYETMLEQEDCLKIQENEFHIPQPNLPTRGYSFKIDPENELRHISKFDHPKNPKYLVMIWNKKMNRMELYFNTAQNLETSIQIDNPRIFRNLNTCKYCLIAVNESKGLIGIYDVNHGILNVYCFDEDQVNLYPRNTNIQILGWYNNSVPDIKHFLFIKNTEELCFVEKSGRARIYNLVNGQFRAGVSQFPPESSAILSTPDGACIVAFVKEPSLSVNENKNHTIDLSIEPESKNFENEDQNPCLENIEISDNRSPQSQSEIVKAHIYFCTEFGKPANKVIEMPTNMQSLELYQFSILHKRQIHLTTLDYGSFRSVIIKITLEKTKYRFQQRPSKKSLGQVKFESVTSNNNYSEFIIIGRETNFIQDIKKGENIVIMGERHKVIEIISEERIKLTGNFSSLLNVEPWLDFRIEPKTRLNGLIDSYKLMFEKYPIDSSKNNQFQPLRDGLSAEDNVEFIDGYHPVDSIARNISFGWYEGIFKHFGDRQVKVVSSMGEQSCGKSYLLNHLIGSTFDGSAMRCTEGVWMSLVVTKKYIYIALDFEGLRSLERSPQEDLFLTLLNTIVSNLILFKNQFAINRDMSSMFQRFQDGATVFEADSRIFQAKLCIIIKDVPKNDRNDVVREFYSRFEQLVTEVKTTLSPKCIKMV
ncbi:unnamed protein product [Rhizophagus irregularis]|nr:unnamed protein product [Rhizophagus irregularis]